MCMKNAEINVHIIMGRKGFHILITFYYLRTSFMEPQ